ncbi:MAG: hypothetical protein PHW60_12385 [Kiritimatiellae bacterium]|nr:hypothetical protein [Kiritimatiellia bacterium]
MPPLRRCVANIMEVQPDFRDLLALLNAHKVEYLIVGGYALAFHGAPRFTGDLDIFVRPDSNNAQRVLDALAAFGFRFPNLTARDFQDPNKVVQLGVPPVRIDLITSISGVSWEEAEASKEPGIFGNVPVCYIGRQQYLANKRAAGRKKDLADIEALGENTDAEQRKPSARGKRRR